MTSFVFCRGCAHQTHESAPTCPKCGAPQLAAASPAPAQIIQSASTPSGKWATIFILIEKAGGTGLPRKNALSSAERKKVTWNGWAAFFGFFYFFAKEMWKKGLSIFALNSRAPRQHRLLQKSQVWR